MSQRIFNEDWNYKYKPKYNIVLKDDKSFLYIVIKKELFPSVVTSRKTNLDSHDINFGPFTSSSTTKQIVRIVRKIFPLGTALPLNLKNTKNYSARAYMATWVFAPPHVLKKSSRILRPIKVTYPE